MIRRLLAHEWRVLRRDAALKWTLLGFTLLVLAAVVSGAYSVRFHRQVVTRAVNRDQSRWAELREKVATGGDNHPANLVYALRPQAVIPPGPLAGLAVGQSDLYPSYFLAKARSDQFYAEEEIENPLRLLTGSFDVAFLFVYLYPLVILAFTYNLLTEERASGRLTLALTQGVSLRALLLAKIGVRMAVILTATLGVLSLAVLLSGGLRVLDLSSPGVWVRVAVWLAVVVGYGLFWFALAVLVNALGRSSAANAVILGGAWLALVVIVPAVVNAGAASAYPVPSRVTLISRARGETNEAMQRSTAVLASHYADHPEFAPVGGQVQGLAVMTEQVAVEEQVERLIAPLVEQFDRQMERRQRLVGGCRFLSPAILAHSALTEVAGTGSTSYRWFQDLGREFREQWRAYFRPRIYRQQMFTVADFDQIPRFAFRAEPLPGVLARAALDTTGIVLLALLAACAGMAGLRKFSPVG